MNGQEILAQLRHHYLFVALDTVQRERVMAHVGTRPFAQGERLFNQGDTAGSFYLLLSGAVKLYRVSADGHEKVMRFIRPGQSFAESVMFMDEPRYLVHGEGLETGTLVVIDRETFLDILRESFATCRAVMAQMTRRIQAHWDEIEALTLQNSRHRVVHYLLGIAPENSGRHITVRLPTRKTLIAAQLAITPETFSRVLRALSGEGLITVRGDMVDIHDTKALRRRVREEAAGFR